MQTSAKADEGTKNGELVRYSSDSPFAFMREIFERFDIATPRIDIEHRGDQLFIQIDLPGISPDDLAVDLDEYTLTLEGERRERLQRPEGDVVRSERTFGRFARVLPLPQHVDPESAEAYFDNGVLEIKARVLGNRPHGRRLPINVVRSAATTTH